MKSYPTLLPSVLVLALSLASRAAADVRPNALFSDNAVLQQNAALPVWGTADAGEAVTVELDGQTAKATADKDGKWKAVLKPQKAGGPFTLTIKGNNTVVAKNVLVGEVWICSGQSNMNFGLGSDANAAVERPKAANPQLRMFTVVRASYAFPSAEVTGKWVVSAPGSSASFSAVGYYFGRDIQNATGFPVGMIHTSVSGTPAQAWTSLAALEKVPALADYAKSAHALIAAYPERAEKYPAEKTSFDQALAEWNAAGGKEYEAALKAWPEKNKAARAAGLPAIPKPEFARAKPAVPVSPHGTGGAPTVLFNGMIAPLVPYAIKGAIWYQGEANSGKAAEYRTLFPTMIADWRAHWGQGDFPFFFVQIAPHNGMRPEIREAQLLTAQSTPNTAMAVITDVGDAENIHPRQKEPAGARLALAARALTYGEKIEYSGPLYASFKAEGNRAIVSFTHLGGGLVAKDGPLKGFTVAGADKKFVEAKAEIVGDTIVVTSDQVATPTAVRYGWARFPVVNLINKAGIPASPFRSDTESAE